MFFTPPLLLFVLYFLVCWLIVLPPLSLNSIAYRRVIYVYQYQVADDLSGRSFSPSLARFFFLFFFLLSLTLTEPSELLVLLHQGYRLD